MAETVHIHITRKPGHCWNEPWKAKAYIKTDAHGYQRDVEIATYVGFWKWTALSGLRRKLKKHFEVPKPAPVFEGTLDPDIGVIEWNS